MTCLEKTHYVAHIIFKAQVYHPIRFIHTEKFAIVESETFFLQHIDQSPGRCNYYVKTLAHVMTLLAHRNSTNAKKRV